MRKNFFGKLAGLVLAASMMFSLTSCEDLFGEWDKPTPVVQEVINTIVEVTGATPEAVTAALKTAISDEAVAAAAAKGEPIKITVSTTSGIGTEAADKTITIPQKNGADIEISFVAAPTGTTAEPLEFKAEGVSAGTASGEKENELAIAMPDATGLVITIDLPKTTVTLTTTGSNTVYKTVTAKTANETLNIAKGVEVQTLNAEGGSIVVEEGKVGTINVSKEAESVKLSLLNAESPVEKLSIADGATVTMETKYEADPYVKEIEGGTEGTGKLLFNETSYHDQAGLINYGFLTNVEKLKNVTLGILSNMGGSELRDVPTDVENVIFEASEVYFRKPSDLATATIKNCTFKGVRRKDNKPANVSIELNTVESAKAGNDSYTYTFESCNFEDESNYLKLSAGIYDKENTVYFDVYYWNPDNGGSSKSSRNFDDVPQDRKNYGQTEYADENGERSKGYWVRQSSETPKYTFNNYVLTLAFSNCTYKGSPLAIDSNFFSNLKYWVSGDYINAGMTIKVKIGDSIYKLVQDVVGEQYYENTYKFVAE